MVIGGGDPKDTNHTPIKTMFTLKKVSKNNSNKKSTQKGAATINKPELAADLGIDTSIDISNKDFLLSQGINRKLESGSLDRQIDIIETQQLGKLLGRGKQQSIFEDPLNRGTGNLGGLQLRDRLGRSRDIEDLAGQHSSVNRLGGAGSADRYDSPGEKSPEWEEKGVTINARGKKITYYVNKNDADHTKRVYEYTSPMGSKTKKTVEKDIDTTGEGDKKETVTETKNSAEWIDKDGNKTEGYENHVTIENEEGTTTITAGEAKVNGKVTGRGSSTGFRAKSKTDAQRLEDPANENNARPMTDKDDPMGIIGDRDSMYKRLRIINPEIDPMNEGDQAGYGNYINPALSILGTSNGGRSTGAWEEVGGAYVGPNIGAINDSLGGTSTGNDWF